MSEIEILEFSGEGYMPLISYEGWRVAVINFKESLRFDRFNSMELHTRTDEVFIPLKGMSTLFVGDDAKRIDMEIGKIYNVKKDVWHHICMSEDARVAVVENDNTGKENTIYKEYEER